MPWPAAATASFLGPLIGAGISTIGGYLTGKSQQRFAERMSSTAHQREVADLRAAGLNPILSANRGASTPTPSIPNLGLPWQNALFDAITARKIYQEGEAVRLENEKRKITKKPYELLNTMIDTGELPELPDWLKPHVKKYLDAAGREGKTTGVHWQQPADRRRGPGAWKIHSARSKDTLDDELLSLIKKRVDETDAEFRIRKRKFEEYLRKGEK